jgi:solute carrier family 25 phosphate transporter 23/24/25/41
MAATHLVAEGQEVSVPLLLACGMTSSALASVTTFPIVVIRTKAQATGKSVGACVQTLWREGVRGFYRGIVPSLMKVMPAAAISYTAYDRMNNRWTSQQ